MFKKDYYKSPLGYDNVDWFVNEVKKLEDKMASYIKNFKKDIIMKREMKILKMIAFVDFMKKKIKSLIKLEIIVT